MSLTPDLAEWLLADKKVKVIIISIMTIFLSQVCRRWRSLARRLSLGCHIPSIERIRGDDSAQLRMVLRMWQATFPDGYTVRGCKNALAAEVSFQWAIILKSLTNA